MVKLLRYPIIFICLLILLLFGSASWILHSPKGTSWLLNKLPEWTGLELTIGQIEGTLGGTLQLKNIKLQQQGEQLSLDHFSMQNQLTGLLPLTLEIKQLHAENLQIQSTSMQQDISPTTFNWPELPWLLDWLQVDLNDINLQNISWQQQGEKLLQIKQIQGDLHWQNGNLQSSNFQLQSGELQGSGSFSCVMKRPALKVDLQIETENSASAWQKLQLQANLNEGSEQQILHGTIALDIAATGENHFTAVSELVLTTEQLRLQQLKLKRPDHPGTVTAEAQLNFSTTPPELAGQFQLNQLDLEEETGQPIKLSGTAQIEGNLKRYHGNFDFINQKTGVANIQLTSNFTGTLESLFLENLRGVWLSGTLNGQAQIGWKKGWQVKTQLSAKDIDPQTFNPQLAGRLNLGLQADFSGRDDKATQGQLQLQLHDSILHNQPLTGSTEIYLQDNSLRIKQLQLQGRGIHLQASGNPEEKLTFNWQIEGMEHLLANTAGNFTGKGWLRWQQESLQGTLQASGENLTFADWQLDRLSLQGEIAESETPWKLQLDGQLLHNRKMGLDIEEISIGLKGDLDNHQLTLNLTQQQSVASAKIQGSWDGNKWQGELSSATVTDSPFGNWQVVQAVPILLSEDQLTLEPLSIHSDNGSELQLQGNYHLKQQQGIAKIHWQSFDLSLFDPLVSDWLVSGLSDGTIDLERGEKNRVHAEITARGEIQSRQLKLILTHSKILINWDKTGLQSSLQATLADKSNLKGTLTSAEKNNFDWPQQGEIQLSGKDIPLNIVQPWLAEELDLNGTLDWDSKGEWRADQPLNLKGTATINDGEIHWQDDEITNSAEISSAELNWQWNEELKGELDLKSPKYGKIETTFNLPLAAKLPLVFDPDGAINANLQVKTYELGLLSVYFPQYFQKSQAQVKLDLQLTGSWRQPNLTGDFHLFDANMFLPIAGIQLNKIELQGNVSGTRVEIVKLQCKSGKGELNGTGQLELKKWFPATYHLQLKGKKFQLINHPELQVVISPDLSIDGTEESIKVRGVIKLPNVQVNNQQESGTISNSPDLKIVDNPIQTTTTKKLKYDIDLQLVLSKKIFLRTANVDARLGGKLRIQSSKNQSLVGSGKISVIRGTYFGLGANLNITYGDIFFTGGPLDQPDFDILALRRINEVEVGAKITGTPQTPDVQLYSRPIMPEGDILSYLLTGQPMSAFRSQTNLLLSAASALFPPGKSQGIINRLGLDTFYISSDFEEDNEKKSTTVITTGKYLNPDLYLSFGYSPDSNSDRVKVRYRLTPVWEIESTVGYDSGADIFYRIEFD